LRAEAGAEARSDGLWYRVPWPVYSGGNAVTLLRGGDDLFPAMHAAIDAAQHEVWLASYIFHDDAAGLAMAEVLVRAAQRGVRVQVVVDGFGSNRSCATLRQRLVEGGVHFAVFRPLDRWTQWLQPGQLRRQHMKLCVVDHETGFIGGINIIGDRLDIHHGISELPRLDFAAQVRGPVVLPMSQAVRAVWSRATLGRAWRQEAHALLTTPRPLQRLQQTLQQVRMPRRSRRAPLLQEMAPMRAALVLRDNLRQRRTIERSYVAAIARAQRRVWLVSPYFYPGQEFRRALRQAAQRGVDVRLLLQGKLDYRVAGLAARVLYRELLRQGVQVYEYTPAFLHAKVALVDDDWATVGSSNIDPLSLLLNLEANLIVRESDFVDRLARELEHAWQASQQIGPTNVPMRGWVGWVGRAVVAWCAYVYLRVAGVTGRY
jgi:cardiolipin synthase